jgi:L-arabinose isomerase
LVHDFGCLPIENGWVTRLSVVQTGVVKLLLPTAEGESVAGPVRQIGNTNRRYHCAIGVGHLADKLAKLG